jgi:3-oxoadipate enol-lactonase
MPWIEANGIVLRYQLTGAGSRTLVLVHEMGGTLESWDAVAPLLARRYRVLRFDMRGSGLSEWRPGAVGIADLSADMAGLLDALGIAGPCAVAGCAVGAAVAIHFAAAFPHRTAALVAMAPAVGLPPERRQAALARAAELERLGTRPSVDEQLARTYPPEMRTDAERFLELRNRRLAANPFAAAALGRMLADLDLTAEMALVACPSLVLGGNHDGVRPPDGVAETARQIPGAEIRLLPTGHFMPLQTPELVSGAIDEFVSARWAQAE